MTALYYCSRRITSWRLAALVLLTSTILLLPNIGLAAPAVGGGTLPPLLVQESEAKLVATGCKPVALNDQGGLTAARSNGWREVVPSDATGQTLVMCPPTAAEVLAPVEAGRVAGQVARAAEGNLWDSFVENAASAFSTIGTMIVMTLLTPVFLIFSLLFAVLGSVGAWIFAFVATFLVPLLTLNEFVSNDAVRSLWPVVLSIVNLGFLLGLLFIALLTSLRLDIGGGVRRLLPRLLIAAVLVNFSLVIAGLVLDASRVVMALLPRIVGVGSLDDFGDKIYGAAGLPEMTVAVLKTTGWGAHSVFIGQLVSMIVVWVIAIAALVLLVGLLVRFIMLLLLLIISPVAYLFIAFPNTVQLAVLWWKTFIKYVIYGPVVLFILLLAVSMQGQDGGMKKLLKALGESSGGVISEDMVKVFSTVFVAALLVLAAMAGKYAGILGSSTAVSLVARGSKRVAYRGGRGIGKGLYVGSGARAVGRGLRNQARDFGRTARAGIRNRLPARVRPVRRDSQERPVRGQPLSAGQRLANRLLGRGGLTRAQQTQQNDARNFAPSGATPMAREASVQGAAALSPSRLQQRHVGGALNRTTRRNVMSMGSAAQRIALAGNSEAVRGMDEGERDVILNLDVDLNTTSTGRGSAKRNSANALKNSVNRKIQEALMRSMNRITREDQGDTGDSNA